MRRHAVVILCALVVACDRDDGGGTPLRLADGSVLSNAGGEVALSDGARLRFVITSERFKQWDAARVGMSRSVIERFGVLLKPKAPTEQSIERAVAYLEGNAGARQSIERTGMSVRDFVLMTVALEQEMRLASGQAGRASPLDVIASESLYIPPPLDTALPAGPLVRSVPVDSLYVYPQPLFIDTVRVDTGFPQRDTTVRPPRGDTIFLPRREPVIPAPPPRRDTAPLPPRDTLFPPPAPLPPRDTLFPPPAPLPPRDTTRDTTSAGTRGPARPM